MKRKNAFSYFIWVLYSMAVCVSLFGISATLSKQVGQTQIVGFGISGVWLLLCGLMTFLLHKLVKKISSEKELGRMTAIVIENLFVAILFIAGIVLRICGLVGAGEDAAYYELAKVAEGQAIPAVVHGAVYIYLQLLHFVYWIFGNKFLAGIGLQIVLQVIAGGFLYLAVRKLAGVISALVMLGFFMLSPMMINEALNLSPEVLFLAVFSIILYVCAKCIRDSRGGAVGIVAGVLISVTCYLDIMGIILLLITVAGLLLLKNEVEDSFSKRLVVALLCVLSCVIGFVVLMAVDALASAKEIVSVTVAWWKLYIPSAFDYPAAMGMASTSIEVFIVVMLMAFGIFSFWCDTQKERQSVWALSAFALILLQCFGMTTAELSGNLNLYIIIAALAGIGVAGMFAKESAVSRVWADGRLEAQLEAMSRDIVDVPQDDVSQNQVPQSVVEQEEKVQQDEKPKVNFIENPLPLPKKHVKKVMDFDLELSSGMDDFDIEVDENDDFDI